MQLRILLATAAILLTMSVPLSGAITADDLTYQWAPDLRCEHYSAAEIAAHNGVIDERFPVGPDMYVAVHMLCLTEIVDEVSPLTDCVSKAYSLTGWRWTTPYNAQWDLANPEGLSGSTILSTINAASNTWDNAVAADIFGNQVQGGSAANIRRQDFVNQQGFKNLGGGGTIAVTYTWAYNDGRAAESDAAYNTYFNWATSGASNAMDFQSIGTHEMGHTFGMGHSSTASANSCLTMYPYGANGQTYQRTLGDGDLLGIDAIY